MADEHESKEAEVSLSLPRDHWERLFLCCAQCIPLTHYRATRKSIADLEEQLRRHKAGSAKKPFQECPQCKGSRLEKFCEAIPCTKCDGTGFYPVITCRVVNAGKGEPPPFDFEDDE